jgi:hypothetical protein
MDFKSLFKAFPRLGLPDPSENSEFRQDLINALLELDVPETREEEKFLFSDKEYKRQLEILNSTLATDVSKNRAANWILTAYEEGHIKKNVKKQILK